MTRTKQTARNTKVDVIVFDPTQGPYHFHKKRLVVFSNDPLCAIATELGIHRARPIPLHDSPDGWQLYDQREDLKQLKGLAVNTTAEFVARILEIERRKEIRIPAFLFGKVVFAGLKTPEEADAKLNEIRDIVDELRAFDAREEKAKEVALSAAVPAFKETTEWAHGVAFPTIRKRKREDEEELPMGVDKESAKRARVEIELL
jgi:hypothetical protein